MSTINTQNLKELAEVLHRHQQRVVKWLSSPQVRDLSARSEALLSRRTQAGFNLFTLISPIYTRENLHSDILAALLDPAQQHGGGQVFAHEFLGMIRRIVTQETSLSVCNYRHIAVEREPGRIDILLRDTSTNHAVIIENKINGAADTPRQLPRYLDWAKVRGLTVDAIVYLTLDNSKTVAEVDYTEKDRQRVHGLLCRLPAYSTTGPSLLKDWLEPCQHLTQNIEALAVLRQYASLIRYMGGNQMNESLMQDFYGLFFNTEDGSLNQEAWKNATSVFAMMTELPAFRASNIVKQFLSDCSPFDYTAIHKQTAALFLFNGCKGVAIDIWCQPDRYDLSFWDREAKTYPNRVHEILNQCPKMRSLLTTSNPEASEMVRSFRFPDEEQDLFSFLRDALEELSAVDGNLLITRDL